MNMTVTNSSLNIADTSSNPSTGWKLDKQVAKKTFAEVQADQVLPGNIAASTNMASVTSASTASDNTSTVSLNSAQAVDQLSKQAGKTMLQDVDPNAAMGLSSDTGQSTEGSVTAAGTSTQTDTLTTSQLSDQLFIHGQLGSLKSADPKVGSTPENTAQSTTSFPAGTFKALFGDMPSNVDRSGLSGITDSQGHNLTKQEITSYFDQNPSTTQMEQDKLALGLSDAQMANAIAIAMGQPYTAPTMDSSASGASGSGFGSSNATNNLYSSVWGTSDSQSNTAVTSGATPAISYIA
ncbi:MAG: hypothetical protein ABIZ09_18590 [Rhodoferax sp.]